MFDHKHYGSLIIEKAKSRNIASLKKKNLKAALIFSLKGGGKTKLRTKLM